MAKIIENDKEAKREHRNQDSRLDNKISDFGEKNVLSYIYEKKEHKSLKMGQKNEYMVNLMQSQFQSEDKVAAFEKKA